MKKIFIMLMMIIGVQSVFAEARPSLKGDCQQKNPTQYMLGLTEGIRTTLMPKNVTTSLSNEEIATIACQKTLAKNPQYRFNLMLRAEIRNQLQNR